MIFFPQVISLTNSPTLDVLVLDYAAPLEKPLLVDSRLDRAARYWSERKLSGKQRAAVEFRLAQRAGGGTHILAMVRASHKGGRNELPEALGRLYLHRPSPQAEDVLFNLRLDGGPAETLFGVRLTCLEHRTLPLARALRRRAKGRVDRLFDPSHEADFTKTLIWYGGSEPELLRLQNRAGLSKDPSMRFLHDYLQEVRLRAYASKKGDAN